MIDINIQSSKKEKSESDMLLVHYRYVVCDLV